MIAARLKAVTDMPVLVGVGVSHAAAGGRGCAGADGVVQGAASCGGCWSGTRGVGEYVAEVRARSPCDALT